MKFELNRLITYSDESLMDELKRVATLAISEKLSKSEFDKHSKVHSTTIVKRFGSWRIALSMAGLNTKYDDSNKKLSKSDIIEELKKVHKIICKSFTFKEFKHHSNISSNSINKYFKGYSEALIEAGIFPKKESLRYDDKERFENLLTVWTHYGRQPSYKEMSKPPSLIGGKSYVTRWGSWIKALLAFLERVNQDIDFEEIANEETASKKVQKNANLKTKTPQSDKREIPLGLRYDVLKRDNFKCKLCGKSPATEINCKLQVDHILAWANGGKTTKENLRTLCFECNNGKSDKK